MRAGRVGRPGSATAATLALLASGCNVIPLRGSSEIAVASGARIEEALVVGAEGPVPAQVRVMVDEPLGVIVEEARAGEVGAAFELARRFEEGIGLPRDVACAVFWYMAADEMEYRGALNVTRGMPHARAAVRRLAGEHAEARAARDDPNRAASPAYDRCDEDLG